MNILRLAFLAAAGITAVAVARRFRNRNDTEPTPAEEARTALSMAVDEATHAIYHADAAFHHAGDATRITATALADRVGNGTAADETTPEPSDPEPAPAGDESPSRAKRLQDAAANATNR